MENQQPTVQDDLTVTGMELGTTGLDALDDDLGEEALELEEDLELDLDAGLPDDEPLLEEDLDLDPEPVPVAIAAAPAPEQDARLRRLEAAARSLAAAEVDREQRRLRRKVTAATTGAGAVGFVPILLQLVGALELRPELASAVSTIAALVGALAAGYFTPERQPPLPAGVAHDLLAIGARGR